MFSRCANGQSTGDGGADREMTAVHTMGWCLLDPLPSGVFSCFSVPPWRPSVPQRRAPLAIQTSGAVRGPISKSTYRTSYWSCGGPRPIIGTAEIVFTSSTRISVEFP